ncbi:hypothetical protein RRG08_059064, partial [Elysia crispata]
HEADLQQVILRQGHGTGDLQAVEDFCSACQFIGLRNGSLRVLRLLNEAHWRRLPQTFQRT